MSLVGVITVVFIFLVGFWIGMSEGKLQEQERRHAQDINDRLDRMFDEFYRQDKK